MHACQSFDFMILLLICNALFELFVGFKQKDTDEHMNGYVHIHFAQSMEVINKQNAILALKDHELSQKNSEIQDLRRR